jgi:hypothetical protein
MLGQLGTEETDQAAAVLWVSFDPALPTLAGRCLDRVIVALVP